MTKEHIIEHLVAGGVHRVCQDNLMGNFTMAPADAKDEECLEIALSHLITHLHDV